MEISTCEAIRAKLQQIMAIGINFTVVPPVQNFDVSALEDVNYPKVPEGKERLCQRIRQTIRSAMTLNCSGENTH